MPDLDLLELLAADHVNLREDISGSGAVAAVEKHLTVERALLYPTVEHRLPRGAAIAEELRGIDRKLIDALEHGGEPGRSADIADALEAHIAAQESHYPELRREVSTERLVELADELPLVMEEAPTRLHPRLPDHGPLREVTSEIAAVIDQLRDT